MNDGSPNANSQICYANPPGALEISDDGSESTLVKSQPPQMDLNRSQSIGENNCLDNLESTNLGARPKLFSLGRNKQRSRVPATTGDTKSANLPKRYGENTVAINTDSADTLSGEISTAESMSANKHFAETISANKPSAKTESTSISSAGAFSTDAKASETCLPNNEFVKSAGLVPNGKSSKNTLPTFKPSEETSPVSLLAGVTNCMELAVPTKDQLLNEFGGGLGHVKSNVSASEDVLEIGKIHILKNKVLGQGPSSIVYEGRLESLNGMPVAVKRITCKNKYMAARTRTEMDEIWKKLDREVNLLRGLEPWRHPNIVGFYQSQTVSHELYLAFQLCQGDLEDYVSEEFKFWREMIGPLEINKNMAEGIKFLHANSIVHRDLKPKNVFLVWQQSKCRAVIGDFGMSKVTDKGFYSLSLSVGSVGYLAPEVWEEASKAVRRNHRERPKIEDKSDIFSLGLLFFFTTSNGQHPFGDELLGSQLQIAAGRLPNFNHSRPEEFTMENLLRRMFVRNPGSRPTAEEVLDHPGLWDNDIILKFLADCSDHVENIVKKGKSIGNLVPDNLLPRQNWMNELPDALRIYLKKRRHLGKLVYKNRESSTRYFLRAIRNIFIHFPELPDDVKNDFLVHQAVFWTSRCPRLVVHLYDNIERTGFLLPKQQKSTPTFILKKTTSNSTASAKSVVLTTGSSGSLQQKNGRPHRASSSQYRGKGSHTTDTILLPSLWVPMYVNETNKTVVLQSGSVEYREVAERFIHEVKSGAYAHKMEYETSKLKIVQIERIQNKSLYQQFKVRKNQIANEKEKSFNTKTMIRQLWHGTTADSTDNIIKHGFNRGYSGKNGTWFGDGVYFAVDASYAARAWLTQCIPKENGEGHVFLADVITGQYCRGHYGMRYLPPIDTDEPTVLYDSAVDDPELPMEFVIFHDTQAYPSYHITFSTL